MITKRVTSNRVRCVVVSVIVSCIVQLGMTAADRTECRPFGTKSDGQTDGQTDNDRRGYPDTCISAGDGSECGSGSKCVVVADKTFPEKKVCALCPGGGEVPCSCTPKTTFTEEDVIKGVCKWGTNDPSLPKECYCEYSGQPEKYKFYDCDIQ